MSVPNLLDTVVIKGFLQLSRAYAKHFVSLATVSGSCDGWSLLLRRFVLKMVSVWD